MCLLQKLADTKCDMAWNTAVTVFTSQPWCLNNKRPNYPKKSPLTYEATNKMANLFDLKQNGSLMASLLSFQMEC